MWRAFWDLAGDRAMGMSMGTIRFEAISAWAERHGVLDFDRFAALIRAMDSVYLEQAQSG